MKRLIRTIVLPLIILAMGISGVFAQNLQGAPKAPALGHLAPSDAPVAKSDDHLLASPVVDNREGGEAIADAIPITSIPFDDTGATCDNVDDYDEACPYDGSTSPDVVYSFYLQPYQLLTVDLCGSSYDTKLFVYDEGMNVLACNDDYYFDAYCGMYTSYLELWFEDTGRNIYIVIDGYGGDCGEYLLSIAEIMVDCFVICPDIAVLENEPPLQDDYVDSWNGGCNSPDYGAPFQALWGDENGHRVFCGVTGWYEFEGNSARDTDWFTAVIDESGVLEIYFEAEHATYLFELWPQNCDAVEVDQQVEAQACLPVEMQITGTPGDLVWLWVGPTVFDSPSWTPFEYDYMLGMTGLQSEVIGVEAQTWSAVKSMYR